MKREELIREACSVYGLVFASVYPGAKDRETGESVACDCICDPTRKTGYSNTGHVGRYIRQAVLEKMERGGEPVNDGWDPNTGLQVLPYASPFKRED